MVCACACVCVCVCLKEGDMRNTFNFFSFKRLHTSADYLYMCPQSPKYVARIPLYMCLIHTLLEGEGRAPRSDHYICVSYILCLLYLLYLKKWDEHHSQTTIYVSHTYVT